MGKRKKRKSIVYQVEEAMKAILRMGKSRHKLKQAGTAGQWIVSSGTMETYQGVAVRCAKWCEAEHDVRYIRQITPDMAKGYVQSLRDDERSGQYVKKVISAIRKFDVALRAKGHRPRNAPPLMPPDEKGWSSDPQPERAYTPAAAERIAANMAQRARDKQTADVVRLQHVVGLRVNEAVYLRGMDIDVEGCRVYADKKTKGHRPRTVGVDRRHQGFLQAMRDRAAEHRDGHIFQGRRSLDDRTREAVRQACKRLGEECYSTHGFRKTFAQTRYVALREQGLDDREARQRVAEDLGHNRVDVTAHYVPREWTSRPYPEPAAVAQSQRGQKSF